MSNYELLTSLCNKINQSINNNCGSSVQSHNYLQDKLVELQEQFENLLKGIESHNVNYPNE